MQLHQRGGPHRKQLLKATLAPLCEGLDTGGTEKSTLCSRHYSVPGNLMGSDQLKCSASKQPAHIEADPTFNPSKFNFGYIWRDAFYSCCLRFYLLFQQALNNPICKCFGLRMALNAVSFSRVTQSRYVEKVQWEKWHLELQKCKPL